MQPADVDGVTDAVLTASRVLVGVAARSLAEVEGEVTLVQYRALVVLCARGPQLMSELADQLSCSRSTATRLCDRLVAKGLITRDRGSHRREVAVEATASTAQLVRTVTRRRRADIGRIVSRVPPRSRPALVRALRNFAAAAGELADQSWWLGFES